MEYSASASGAVLQRNVGIALEKLVDSI